MAAGGLSETGALIAVNRKVRRKCPRCVGAGEITVTLCCISGCERDRAVGCDVCGRKVCAEHALEVGTRDVCRICVETGVTVAQVDALFA